MLECAIIRGCVKELMAVTAETVRIQYGGSVNAANASELFNMPDIDGGLVGEQVSNLMTLKNSKV